MRDRARWADAIPAGLGVAVPVALVLWFNQQTTGSPFLFGYELLWGKSHALGFHRAPWGEFHTPARGAELINLYFFRLQTYLLETPVPSLLPVVGALALARRVSAFDRYLLASGALLVASYFAYWHDGFFLGPRFMFVLLPLLALWSARLPSVVGERFGRGLAYRGVVYGAVVAGAMALALSVPLRARIYAEGLAMMRLDFVGAARRANVRNALVLVRESWGAQVVARMWALGIPHSEAETLYRGIDTCALDEGVSRLERSAVRDTAAYVALRPLLRDSARVVRTPYSSDITERVLPDRPYSEQCVRRVREDQEGFALLAPLLVADREGNEYVRDLHARDTLMLRRFPDRPVYLMRTSGAAIGAPPVFYRLDRDSLERSWRSAR
jgi:hypothetical protein